MTRAERMAKNIWESNARALHKKQPCVASLLAEVEIDVEWVFARDGSLSALEGGRWWAGCSVPLLSGRSLLSTLADEPVGSCQLAPAHAGLVRAAREKMGNCPVLFVAQPDARTARMILSTHDFSEEIDRGRFWIFSGDAWLAQIKQMFLDNPGLATPLRFIRTRLTLEETSLPMITEIQNVFSQVLSVRGDEVGRLKALPRMKVDPRNILLVGGSEFRLWDFGTRVIEKQLEKSDDQDLNVKRFDMDDAFCGSPLALLTAAEQCGCILSADVCRADCNQLISPEIPWITWMTQPGAPPFHTAGPRDILILADEKWRPVARVAGWPAERIRICGWPVEAAKPALHQAELGMICDTRKVLAPASVADFSSHRLLWDLIEEELADNPLAVEDVDVYISDRAGQLNIATEVLDQARFIEGLILPAYQQGLARLLISGGIPLRVYGKGWDELPEFKSRLGGKILYHSDLECALNACCGLVYFQPRQYAHAMEMTGKPIVYRAGADRSAFIREARRVMNGERRGITRDDGDLLIKTMLELTLRHI